MISPRDADHALGLELQIEELVEQHERARVQGRQEDAASIGREIAALQAELADAVERASIGGAEGVTVVAPGPDAAPGGADPTGAAGAVPGEADDGMGKSA